MKKRLLAVTMLLTAALIVGCQNNSTDTAGSDTSEQTGGSDQNTSSDSDSELTDEETTDDESTDEEVSEEETSEEDSDSEDAQADLFSAFLNDNGSLTVSDHFQQANEVLKADYTAGTEYTLDSLKEYLNNSDEVAGTEPQVEYAYLDCPGRKAYAISLYYDTEMEGYTQFFILSEADDHLEMNFAIDGWSRRYPSVTRQGVILDGGSAGAGSHISTTYVPDTDFEYIMLSNTEENAYGFDFYDPDDDSVNTVNAIMNEAAEGSEDAMNVLYYRVSVDGNIYYYFLGGDGSISQDTVDYIDGIAAEHGFTFDGKEAVTEAELEYAKKLGAEEYYNDDDPAEWVSL